WRTLDPAEQERFTKLFRDLIEYTYGNRLSEYKHQKVRIEDPEFKKNKARIRSYVIEPDKEIPIEYRLRKMKDGQWRIYDVRIEGVSMIRTFRQDFQSLLDQGGYAHLVKELQAKVQKLKSQS
ncbi:MAG: ABC transporter substrate-binding protein, partial [Zetaproteobacteria bacterium]